MSDVRTDNNSTWGIASYKNLKGHIVFDSWRAALQFTVHPNKNKEAAAVLGKNIYRRGRDASTHQDAFGAAWGQNQCNVQLNGFCHRRGGKEHELFVCAHYEIAGQCSQGKLKKQDMFLSCIESQAAFQRVFSDMAELQLVGYDPNGVVKHHLWVCSNLRNKTV